MRDVDKQTYIAEEAFMILHSGEIPEVALHSSIHYLTEDPDGPALELGDEDVLPLKQAVAKRYRVIILRDLDPENRDKRIYRGLARCKANWQRLENFCRRECLDIAALRTETAVGLQRFFQQEMLDVTSGQRSSCINCSGAEIEKLVDLLGLSMDDLPDGWQELCPER